MVFILPGTPREPASIPASLKGWRLQQAAPTGRVHDTTIKTSPTLLPGTASCWAHLSQTSFFFFVMLIKYTHAIPTFLLQNYRKQAEEEAGRASGWQPVLWRARKFLCPPLTEMKTTAECSGLHYSFTRPLYIIIPKCIHLARSSFPKHLSIANNCPPSSHTHNVLFFVRRTRLVMNSAPNRQVEGLFGHQA